MKELLKKFYDELVARGQIPPSKEPMKCLQDEEPAAKVVPVAKGKKDSQG